MRNAYIILVGKPKGRKTLGIPRSVWEDNIRMDLREKMCEVVDWMHLSQDRVMNLRVP
jgi:hypothetical protein